MSNKAAFTVDFLTDIVLSGSGATEGQHESLDFIPGSNFLGIAAASLYSQSGFPAFDAFHSGKIRFGNATLYAGQGQQPAEPSLPCPLAWQKPKPGTAKDGVVAADSVLVHHHITHDRRKIVAQAGVQLKPVRGGYFLPSCGALLNPLPKNYSLKSAYDSENRRAKDSSFFGYESLPAGSCWYFEIEADSGMEDPFKRICDALEGTKRLGRSRSAQYGQVRIDRLNHPAVTVPCKDNENRWALYAASRICLFDRHGKLTTAPDAEILGLPEGSKVRHDLSQIRTFQYSPWNGALRRRDAARIGVERGSVFIVDIPDGSVAPSAWREKNASGIGAYRAEGFGRVLLNPEFLEAKVDGCIALSLKESEPIIEFKVLTQNAESPTGEALEKDDALIAWVNKQADLREEQDEIYKRAHRFVTDHTRIYGRISPSQWGAVRAIAIKAVNKQDLLDQLFLDNTTAPNAQGTPRVVEPGGFLMHGKSQKNWKGDPVKTLKAAFEREKEATYRPFLTQVCSEMAKKNKEKQS